MRCAEPSNNFLDLYRFTKLELDAVLTLLRDNSFHLTLTEDDIWVNF